MGEPLSTGITNRKWHFPQKWLKTPLLLLQCTKHIHLAEKKRHLTKKPLKRKRHRMAAPLTNNVDN